MKIAPGIFSSFVSLHPFLSHVWILGGGTPRFPTKTYIAAPWGPQGFIRNCAGKGVRRFVYGLHDSSAVGRAWKHEDLFAVGK